MKRKISRTMKKREREEGRPTIVGTLRIIEKRNERKRKMYNQQQRQMT